MEYSVQFFEDFPPDALGDKLIDDAMNIVDTQMEKAKKKMEELFKTKIGEKYETAKTSYKDNVNNYVGKVGVYLKENILTIPPHVLLPEDRCHAKAFTASDRIRLEQLAENTVQKIKNAKYKNAVLKGKGQNLKQVLAAQEEALVFAKQLEADIKLAQDIEQKTQELKEKIDENLKPLARKRPAPVNDETFTKVMKFQEI